MNAALTYPHINSMVFHMKTTLNIDDHVMQRLREEAARQGRTMSELVEAGLRLILKDPSGDRTPGGDRPSPSALPRWRSGGARIDPADRDALYDAMEAR